MAFMAKRNNPPTDYSCSLHCCAGGLISSVDIFCVVFLGWTGVYRDTEETAVVMETAGAKTL